MKTRELYDYIEKTADPAAPIAFHDIDDPRLMRVDGSGGATIAVSAHDGPISRKITITATEDSAAGPLTAADVLDALRPFTEGRWGQADVKLILSAANGIVCNALEHPLWSRIEMTSANDFACEDGCYDDAVYDPGLVPDFAVEAIADMANEASAKLHGDSSPVNIDERRKLVNRITTIGSIVVVIVIIVIIVIILLTR